MVKVAGPGRTQDQDFLTEMGLGGLTLLARRTIEQLCKPPRSCLVVGLSYTNGSRKQNIRNTLVRVRLHKHF